MLDAPSLERVEVALVTAISNCFEFEKDNNGEYEAFKSCCVSFFIDVVKEFVFREHNSQELSDDIIGKLMSYVCSSSGQGTKKFSPIAEHAIDPSPVIRSFLLKQLLESSKFMEGDSGIDSHISAYLQRSIRYVQEDPRSEWGVYVMFLHCYEDFFMEEALELKRAGNNLTLYINHIVSCLQPFVEDGIDDHSAVTVDLLKRVARIRFALTSAAAILYSDCHDDESLKNDQIQTLLKKLFAYLYKFISKFRNREIHLFFLRMIIRRYGLRELDNIVNVTQFTWLNLEDNDGDSPHRHPDKYLVYGEAYKKLRNEITEGLMADKKIEEIKEIVDLFVNAQGNVLFVNLVASQECFLGLNQLTWKMKEDLQVVALPENLTQQMELLSPIEDPGLLEVLCHLSLMFEATKSHHLVQPYYLMAHNPDQLQNSFFPAMPSDIIKEVEAARAAAVAASDNWTVYRCPNGHRYVIGNCGQAAEAGKCNICDAPIGGTNHQLNANNTAVGFVDASLPCHNLGSVNNRSQNAVPERGLSPVGATIQLFFVHASLLYGVLTGRPGVERLIQPQGTGDLRVFLLAHINRDLEIMQGAIAKSKDDVCILLHLLIKNIIETCQEARNPHQPFPLPLNMESRQRFESAFHQTFIAGVLKNFSTRITDIRRLLLSDIRLGSNPLRRRLHEIDEVDFVDLNAVQPSTVPHFWSYRQPITIEHFTMSVQEERAMNEGKTLQVLSTYLNQLSIFTCLKELPQLIELQKHLSHLAFRLKRQEAQDTTIVQAIQHHIPKTNQKKVRRGVLQVIKLWRDLYPHLVAHPRFKHHVREIPEALTTQSPLIHFLHSQDPVSIPLITFLVSFQNEFLDRCRNNCSEDLELTSVRVAEVKDEHVISYGREDVYRLLFTHCDHSYEMGGRSKIQYNFLSCERDLVNEVLYNSARIDLKDGSDLIFMFADDVRHSQLFSQLHKKITQREIPFSEQKRMTSQLVDIADVSNSLRAIEIAVGFLNLTGGDPNQLYKDYLSNVLIMDVDVYAPSGLIQSSVSLSHLHSAWAMLIVEKAKRLRRKQEYPFDIDYTRLQEFELKDEEDLRNALKHVDSDKWMAFISEFIVLLLPNMMNSESNLQFSLVETLQYVEDTGAVVAVGGVRLPLDLLPDHVVVANVYAVWKIMLKLNEEMFQKT